MKNNNIDNKELSLEQETTIDCPILFRMRNRPMSETCMCWGFECGSGWFENIRDMAYEMEILNDIYYPKYRTRIQMDQIKSKFGELRAYYSIVVDHGKLTTAVIRLLEKLENALNSVSYDERYVYDVKPFDYEEVEESSREEYQEYMKLNVRNVSFKIEGDKYTKTTKLRNCGKGHTEATKHKILWVVKNSVTRIKNIISYVIPRNGTKHTRKIVSFLDTKAMEIVGKAEEKCSKTCELCGSQIGTEWSPVCCTAGWITYVCENCAKKQNGRYTMNGKIMCKGEEVKEEVHPNK